MVKLKWVFGLILWQLAFFLPSNCQAQFLFEASNDIPVSNNNDMLELAWSGGLNSAQYQTIDLNNDENPDLVIFDRTAGKLLTFINNNDNYEYNGDYEAYFPDDINNWVVLADYNCDGKKDIFTNTLFGMKVYKNITETFPAWELAVDPIFTLGSSSAVNLQVNESDIPAISDLDGDGDLDILVFNFFAGRNIEYHQNLSIDKYGICDSLDFQRVDRNWGKFEECDCGDYAFGETCIEKNGSIAPINARPQHAGGKALLAFDNDGDNDKDILFGDEECTDLVFFENRGTNQEAIIQGFSNEFPSASNRITFPFFPAAYYEDINFDGIKDLLVSPNTASNFGDQMDFVSSSWLFTNSGSNDNPVFIFQEKNFIQNKAIDIGENAYPVFIDIDQDNDFDLLIGGRGKLHSDGFYAKVYLFENTGTVNSPSFELTNDDFLSFSTLKVKNLQLFFHDYDKDGLNDLLFTASEVGQNFSKSLRVILNTGNSNSDFNYDINTISDTGFNVNATDNLQFISIAGNEALNILVGKASGKVQHFENNGDGVFALITENFYNIGNDVFKRTPFLNTQDLNGDGKIELIITDATGNINIYDDFETNLSSPGEPVNEVINNPVLESITNARFGKQSWTTFADLDNDKLPEMVVGTVGGGVHLFKNKSENKNPEGNNNNLIISVFPNPITGNNTMQLESNSDAIVEIYSILGQKIEDGIRLKKNQRLSLNVSTLSNGLYLIKASNEFGKTSEKLLIQK